MKHCIWKRSCSYKFFSPQETTGKEDPGARAGMSGGCAASLTSPNQEAFSEQHSGITLALMITRPFAQQVASFRCLFSPWTFCKTCLQSPHTYVDTCQLCTQKVCQLPALSAKKEADFLYLKWILTGKEGGKRRKKSEVRKIADSGQSECIWCEITSLAEFGQGLELCKSLFQQNLGCLRKLLGNFHVKRLGKTGKSTEKVHVVFQDT